MRSPISIARAAFAVALLLPVACGSDGPKAASGSLAPVSEGAAPEVDARQSESEGSGSEMVLVEVIDTDFKPVSITIQRGSKIQWQQVGDQPHSVSAKDGSFDSSPDCGPLDSDRCLGQGDTFSHTFDVAGEYTYYCRVHGLPDGTGMVGVIVVK